MIAAIKRGVNYARIEACGHELMVVALRVGYFVAEVACCMYHC